MQRLNLRSLLTSYFNPLRDVESMQFQIYSVFLYTLCMILTSEKVIYNKKNLWYTVLTVMQWCEPNFRFTNYGPFTKGLRQNVRFFTPFSLLSVIVWIWWVPLPPWTSIIIIISLILLKNTFGKFFILLKKKKTIINKIFRTAYRIVFLWFKIYFILLLITFYSDVRVVE